jgi:hypothetical protein
LATVTELQSRVRAALELGDTEPTAPVVLGWVTRAVVSLSDFFNSNPRFSIGFKGMVKTTNIEVGADNRFAEPGGCLRVLTAGTVNGRYIARVVRHGEYTVQDEFLRASIYEPWLRELGLVTDPANAQKSVNYLEVRPRKFERTTAHLYYIKEPEATDVIGDEIADAVVFAAAKTGAIEQGDQVKLGVMEKRFAEELARLGASA